MQIVIKGVASVYEPENIARMFFPGARLEKALGRGDAVLARAGRRLAAGVRLNGVCTLRFAPAPTGEKERECALAALVYELLRAVTGIRPPWGKLTGVRPVRIIHDQRAAGNTEAGIEALFVDHYDCTREKFELARGIADLQRPILARAKPLDYSLYIGIPFCPSRCSYCSFVSLSTERETKLMQPYVDALCREVEAMRKEAAACGLALKTIYIGGGTPTALAAAQLRQLMGTVRECFDLSGLEEYTVEAGRPDCTDAEKLAVLKEYGATRISINPQTFSDAVLARIGRRHTAADILRCYREARAAGHQNINMDLIAGLPGDTPDGFRATLEQVLALAPENVTVHTLSRKRGADLMTQDAPIPDGEQVGEMLDFANTALDAAGYAPYYLYRQKFMSGGFENVGWTRPGQENLYNICIMEELCSILAMGGGASTKLVRPNGGKLERHIDPKYPTEYIANIDRICAAKAELEAFFQ